VLKAFERSPFPASCQLLSAMASEAAMQLKAAELCQLSFDASAVPQAEAALATFRALGDNRKAAAALRILILGHNAEPAEALRVATEALASCKAAADSIGESAVLLALAEMKLHGADYRKLMESLTAGQEALQVFRTLGEQELELAALSHIANVHICICDRGGSHQEAAKALKFAKEAEYLATQMGSKVQEALALHKMANAFWYHEASLKEGMAKAKKSISIFKELSLKHQECNVLRSISTWQQQKGCFKEAVETSKKVFDLSQQLNTSFEMECNDRALVVAAMCRNGDATSAMAIAKEGLEKAQAKGNQMAEAALLEMLAVCHMDTQPTECLKLKEQALALLRGAGDKHGESVVLKNMSHLQSKLSDTSAATSLEASRELAKELGDWHDEAGILLELCGLKHEQRQFKEAMKLAQEAEAICCKNNYTLGEGLALLNKAGIHAAMHELQTAANAGEDAKAIFRQQGDLRYTANACIFLQDVRNSLGDYEAALEEAKMARGFAQKLGDALMEASILLSIAKTSFAQLGRDDLDDTDRRRMNESALRASKEAVTLVKKMDEKVFLAHCYNSVSQSQGVLGKLKEALKSSGAALTLAEEEGDRSCQAAVLLARAEIYFANGKIGDAKKAATTALEHAQQVQDSELAQALDDLLKLIAAEGQSSTGPAAAAETAEAAATPAAADEAAATTGGYKGPSYNDLQGQIKDICQNLVSVDDLHGDAPLMDAGLDSLTMVQLRNMLSNAFPGIRLPSSLVFDYPTVSAITGNIMEEYETAHAAGNPISK